jgi:4a-hydroxytetrahydrobiopterin dehydratase|tara:strand:+ start:741 stop:1040 length:300 start_codon:yes stop_codon:yes gene_type:complete
MVEQYSKLEIDRELALLNQLTSVHWILKSGKLVKTFTFSNFIEAFGFMTKVALYAEKLGHHPEWFNVYKTVNVNLITHEVGGLSKKDFELAKIMEILSH